MLRRLYDWVMRLAASRHAAWALFAIAFAESSFFPVPPDIMLAPMVLAKPARGWTYALTCTAGSVIEGPRRLRHRLLPGSARSCWLLSVTGHPNGEATLRAEFAKWGVWVILIQGLLPIPYKLITITTGLAHFNIAVFVAASIVTRGARFFGVAWIVRRFGPAMLPVIGGGDWRPHGCVSS